MISKISKYFFSRSLKSTSSSTILSNQNLNSFEEVRVRYAPSPTGLLHIGGLRTALYNYLYARQNDGKFILRIEDTDQTREVKGSVENIINNMKWAGLNWDEGPGADENTKYGPYYQSKRLDLYKKYALQLIENGDAYYCFCSEDRLKNLRESQAKNKLPTKYDRHCKHLQDSEIYQRIRNGERHVIRLYMPKGATEIKDLIHGNVKFDHDNIDDQVLIKSDGFPTYHLANVIDDHLMEISHVIRGEEWLTSLPKHITLYNLLGFKKPEFAHLPLILNPNGGKLSKRNPFVSVDFYKERDYLPEALINHVALLGWSPAIKELAESKEEEKKSEILSLNELIKLFSFPRVQPSNSKLIENKLYFFNGVYLREHYKPLDNASTLDKDKRTNLIEEFKSYLCKYIPDCKDEIEDIKEDKMLLIISYVKERIRLYEELANYSFFFKLPDYESASSKKCKEKIFANEERTKKVIKEIYSILNDKFTNKNFNTVEIAKVFGEFLYKSKEYKNEEFYHILRYLLTGNHSGGPALQVCEIIGKHETLKRIKNFL